MALADKSGDEQGLDDLLAHWQETDTLAVEPVRRRILLRVRQTSYPDAWAMLPELRARGANALADSYEIPLGVALGEWETAAKAAEQLTASATPGSNAYKIGALDVLELTVFKVPEMSKSVQVADSGTANFPLVGDIQAVGRTAQQVERELAAKLGVKYLQNPQVTLFVKEYNSQRVTVEGAVKKPGVFPIRGHGSLMQFIAMAEGLDTVAGSEVVVFRQGEGKRVAARFDLTQIRSGEAPDPALQSGDVIVVSSSLMKETFNNFVKVLPIMGVFAAVL